MVQSGTAREDTGRVTAGADAVRLRERPAAKWECYRCAYTLDTESLPDECPNCHYSVNFWINHVEEKAPTLRDFVRKDILQLDCDESVYDAAKLMRDHDTENVLVTIDGVVRGIVTEKDFLRKVVAEDLIASKVLLRKVMSSTLTTAPPDTPVTEALKLMAARHISRIVVIEGGKPVGIVSHRSILGGSFRATHAEATETR